MPTVSVTTTVTVTVPDLLPVTIGTAMCDISAAIMKETGAELIQIVKVTPNPGKE